MTKVIVKVVAGAVMYGVPMVVGAFSAVNTNKQFLKANDCKTNAEAIAKYVDLVEKVVAKN